MTDYSELRRYYEERKVFRFLKRCDAATAYLAVVALATGAIIVTHMIIKIAGR
jgi:hypothetical protein